MNKPRSTRRVALPIVAIVVVFSIVAVAFATSRDGGGTQSSAARSTDGVGPVGTIWVANEQGDTLTAIDARTASVRMTATGIAAPHNIQASDDGSQVWAVSGRNSQLVGIDTVRMRQIGRVPTGSHPAHVVLAADAGAAYVTGSKADDVTEIDLARLRRRASVEVGSYPHGLRPSPDGRLLLVANMKGESVSVINRAGMRRIGDIDVGDAPVQVAWMPDGRHAFVSLHGEDAVVKIDVGSRRVVGRADTDPGPAQIFVTADGSRLLVANQGSAQDPSSTLSVIDPRTMKTITTIETGRGAHGVAADPTGRFAFVTNMYADEVAFVDLDKRTVIARTKVGALPNGISFSPRPLRDDVPASIRLEPLKAPNVGHGHDGDAH